jgi:hypothetical protein
MIGKQETGFALENPSYCVQTMLKQSPVSAAVKNHQSFEASGAGAPGGGVN